MSKNNRNKKKSKKRSLSRAAATTSRPVVASAASGGEPVASPAQATSVTPSVTATPAAADVDPRTAYVGTDIRRIGIITTVCILLEVGLWYLFASTQLGDQIYKLFTP